MGDNRTLREIIDRMLECYRRLDAANREIRRMYAEGKRQFGLTTEELDLEIIKHRETSARKSRIGGDRVYFLNFPDKGLVKIGVTKHLKSRIATLAGAANKANLIGSIDGDRVSERVIHWQFRQHRQHGEFFSWTPISEQARGMIARNSALLREYLQ